MQPAVFDRFVAPLSQIRRFAAPLSRVLEDAVFYSIRRPNQMVPSLYSFCCLIDTRNADSWCLRHAIWRARPSEWRLLNPKPYLCWTRHWVHSDIDGRLICTGGPQPSTSTPTKGSCLPERVVLEGKTLGVEVDQLQTPPLFDPKPYFSLTPNPTSF